MASPARVPEHDDDPAFEGGGSFGVRLATGLGAAAFAAGFAAVPAGLRLAQAVPNVSGVMPWLACAAALLPAMIAAVFVLRRARVGLRSIAGPDPAARAVGVALWLVLLFMFLATFGAVLRATTHHHALAGTTFAIGGVVAAIGLGVVCARVSSIVASRGERTRRALLLLTSVVVAMTAVLAATRMARALSSAGGEPSSAGALFIDVLAFSIAAAFASHPAFAPRKALAIAGPVGAVLLFALGMYALNVSAGLAPAVAQHAPAIAALSGPIAGR
jgi:hypothetical protein